MGLFWGICFTILLTLPTSFSDPNVDEARTFIVRVRNDLQPSEFSDIEEWYNSILHGLDSDHLEDSEKSLQRGRRNKNKNLLHVYKTVFHGFSATLTKNQAQALETRPEILSLMPDRLRHIQITRSPQFLGLPIPHAYNSNELLGLNDYGSNGVIGVLDTGVWPERPSFRDDGLDPIPSFWKGECDEGEKFHKSLCNKKLVGARFYTKGYDSLLRRNVTGLVKSARDSEGHGTHTASTVAGMRVRNASFLGIYAKGVAVGIAPKSRLAIYKVCWNIGCMDSDIIAGFDKAVEDGVNIISLSIGGPDVAYNKDPIAIASFGAIEKDVLVSASAGNSGHYEISNAAPWITTVGAGTIDRRFPADLILADGRIFTGSSLYKGNPLPMKTYLPLTYGGDASSMCLPESLDPNLVRGKIVVCDDGAISRAAKSLVVREAGGVGIIVTNLPDYGEGLLADAYLIPSLLITEYASNAIRDYINNSPNPRATIIFRGTQVGVKPAPVIASFSSREPSAQSAYVLKPDLIAPGVNILAAWPDGISPTGYSEDPRRSEFNILSGTSMSCPHVSGLAALLKGAHPDWSPAMIRSALMTTTYTHDQDGNPLLDETAYTEATVWDMGAGHVDPEKAVDPGLVYDLTMDDYINFLCASNLSLGDIQVITRRRVNCTATPPKPWNLNLPSIVVAFEVSGLSELKTEVVRTATHVREGASTYSVSISNPQR